MGWIRGCIDYAECIGNQGAGEERSEFCGQKKAGMRWFLER